MNRVQFLFLALGLIGMTLAILAGAGVFDDSDVVSDGSCDPAEPFADPLPPGFEYVHARSDDLDSMLRNVGSINRDDIDARRLEFEGREAGIAWSMKAPRGLSPDEIAPGLVAAAEADNGRASTRDIRIAGHPAVIVDADFGVARSTLVLALAGCRLITLQGSDEATLRRIAEHLIRAS